jgi:hypothetical protein
MEGQDPPALRLQTCISRRHAVSPAADEAVNRTAPMTQHSGQWRSAATRIDHEPRGDGQGTAMSGQRQPPTMGGRGQIHGLGRRHQGCASIRGALAQPGVKTGAVQVPSRSIGVTNAVSPYRFRSAPNAARPITGCVTLVLEVQPQSHISQQSPGGGGQRLTDAGDGWASAVHIGSIHQQSAMEWREQQRGGGPCRSGSNHNHIRRQLCRHGESRPLNDACSIVVGADHVEAVFRRMGAAQCELVFDGTFLLKFRREARVNSSSHHPSSSGWGKAASVVALR